MDSELEALTREHLDGALDDAGRRRLAELLESDPRACAEVADQLQIHHRLRAVLREEEAPSLAEPVLREIRFQRDSPRFSQEVVQRLKGDLPPRARWGRRGMAAACLAIAAAALFHFARPRVETPAARVPEVLFVVGNLPLSPSDARLKERLEQLRLTVTTMRDLDVTASSAGARALVLISSSSFVRTTLAFSPQVAKMFREQSVPLVTLEPMFLPQLGMTPGDTHQVDWAAARDQTHLVITNAAHPLAASLSGRVRAAAAPCQFSWGRPGDDALRIATIEGQASRAAIFAYERGARMPGGTAPARRVSLFVFQSAVVPLTEDGWALFDAAVGWCTGAKP